MSRSINFVLLLSGCAFAFVSTQVFTGEPGRQVEVFVNVYNHPKTGFSCADKAPGQYYADPATKCAVYYVCIANPTGTLSPQSFACPNGTIFSQATRVCRPHEEVYCPLAARYYDNLQGLIDQKGQIDIPPEVPVHVQPIQPVPAGRSEHQPRRQSAPRTKPQPAPQPQPQPQALPPALLQAQPQPQPKPAQPASSLFNSNSRFRNTRTFSAPATTSTTTSAPLSAAAGPAGADYEYDYNDYNETGNANAASSLHAQIIENIAEAIAKESKEAEKGEESAAEKAVSRRKRQSEPWMLSRRKGQLMEALGDLMSLSGDDAQSTAAGTTTSAPTSFTCEDKIAGVAYADIQSDCAKFYVCVTVAKGKLWSYHLNCDQGKRFNQALGMCDNHLSDANCVRSERYYAYSKWHKASKKHFLDSAKKMSAQQ